MPVLAGLLVSLFGSLVNVFALFMAARLAIRVAAVTTFTAVSVAFLVASSAFLNELVGLFPSDSMLPTVYWLVFPPEVVSAVGIVFAFDLSVTLYRMTVHNISIMTAGV